MTSLSIVVPARDAAALLSRTLPALRAALERAGRGGSELIVVDDGSTDASADLARSMGARVVSTGAEALGPAAARNLGVESASGDVVVFVDADVELAADALERLLRLFEDAGLVAAYGAYDDSPAARNWASLYMNLRHHLGHATPSSDAHSFWSGLGAVRRAAFVEVGGFDARAYPRPSIEDVELGRRLRSGGGRIVRDPLVRGKHLKRWSWAGVLATDVRDRALPWATLMQRFPGEFSDLNVSAAERGRALLAGVIVLLLCAACLGLVTPLLLFPAALAAWAANRRLFDCFRAAGSFPFAVAGLAWQQFHYLYAGGVYLASGAGGIALVTVIAATMNLVGIDSMLPHAVEFDPHLVHQAVLDSDLGPKRGKYPFLLVAWTTLWVERASLPADGASVDALLADASDPYWRARLATACLSLLAVPATWFAARRLMATHWALVAAWLVGTSLFIAGYAHQARPHAPAAALAVTGLAGLLYLVERPTAIRHALAGLLCGLSAASFPTGAAVLPAWGVALLAAPGRWGPRRFASSLLSALLIAIPVAWSYLPGEVELSAGPRAAAQVEADGQARGGGPDRPTSGRDLAKGGGAARPSGAESAPARPAGAVEASGVQAAAGSSAPIGPVPAVRAESDAALTQARAPSPDQVAPPSTLLGFRFHPELFDGRGFSTVFGALISHDPLLALLGAVGLAGLLVAALRGERRVGPTIVCAQAFPMLIAIGLYGPSQERYFLPLWPLLALCAARGLELTMRPLVRLRRPWGTVTALSLSAVLLAFPAFNLGRLAFLRSAPDTRELAAQWIAEELDPTDRMFVTEGQLPLLVTSSTVRRRDPFEGGWIGYLRRWTERREGARLRLRMNNEGWIVDGRTNDLLHGAIESTSTEQVIAEEVRSLGATHAIVVGPVQAQGGPDRRWEVPTRMALASLGGRRLFRLTTRDGESLAYPGIAYHLGPRAWMEVWRIDRLGPSIEVLRLETGR
jgi:hypothetical protein